MQTVQEKFCVAPQEQVYQAPAKKPIYSLIKRFFDIVLCSVALVVLSPLFLIVAILIKREDGGPVFFSQTRVTKGGKPFQMYKFRSMCPDAEVQLDDLMEQNEMDGVIFKMLDDPRITKIGKFLRKTSIDELPQLINVIKGDMSIVGPRPPVLREVEEYTPYHMQRLAVKTGLACYRECYGRSNIKNLDEWVESDLKYIRERSLLTDLKVILLTIKVVITCEGAM